MNQVYTSNLFWRLPALAFIIFLLCFPVLKAEAQTKFDNLSQEEVRRIEQCIMSETERLMNATPGADLLKKLQNEGVTCSSEGGTDIVYEEVTNRFTLSTAKTCLKGTVSGNNDWEAFFFHPVFSQASYQVAYPMLCARLEEGARRSPGQANRHSLRDVMPSVGNCPLLTQDELAVIMTHQSPRRQVNVQNDASGVSLFFSINHQPYRNFMIMASTDRDGKPAVLQASASGFSGMEKPLQRLFYSQDFEFTPYLPVETFNPAQFSSCRELIISLIDIFKPAP